MKLKYYLRGLGIGIIVTAVIMGIALGGKRELTDAEIKERAAKLGMIEEGSVLLPGTTTEPTDAEPTDAEPTDAEPMDAEPTDAESTDAEPTADSDAGVTKLPNEEIDTVQAEDTPNNENTVKHEYQTAEERAADTAARNQAATKVAAQIAAQTKADALIRESEDAAGVAGGSGQKPVTDSEAVITVESGNGSDVVSKKLAEAGLVENAETFDKYLCNHDYDYKITIGKHTIPAGSTYDEIARILISAAE